MTFKSTRSLPQRSGKLLRTGMYAAIGAALLAPGVALAQQARQAPQQPQQQQEQKEPQRAEPTTLDAVTVSSDYIPEPLLQSPSVISVVTQADLERSGDSTAAQALTRVSGLSVVGDKFVYVRGLGERYSSALFNGSPLPSPEPLQRVVPLDLFPSEALAGMTVQKTYSVRYPGEFGGGVIDLQGLTVPEKPFAKLTFDIGGNSVSTGSKGLTHYGSDRDWWGYDDGRRDLPDAVIHSGQLINYPNQSREELRALGREMNDPNLYLLQQKNHIDPDLGFGGSAGTAFDIGEETKLGVIGVLNFENKWRTRTGKQQIGFYAGDELGELNQDYDFSTTRDSARVNGLFGLGLKGERHSIAWSTLYVHDTVKESKSRHGFDFNATGDVRDDGTLWLERELVNNQLSGKSAFGEYSDVELEWRLGQAETTRKTPFETGVRYIDRNGSWAFSRYDMRFGAVEDEVKSAGVDVAWHLPTERGLTLSGGLAWSDNDRSSVLRSFQFAPTGSLSVFNQFQRIEYLLSDWNIQNDLVELRETSPNNSGESAYDGKLEIRAAYAQLEGEIAPNWRGSLGIRYEDAEQSVTPLDLFSGEPATGAFNVAPLENDYLLPALSLTWNLADNQQIRLGASKTIARPQFREMAPQQYTDPDNDRLFYGNPFLVDSELTNLDLRYEWFFDEGEYFTAGVFHKTIDNPVEAVVSEIGGAQLAQSYVNAPEATLFGLELDFKKYFDAGFRAAWLADGRLYVAANYTWSESEVNVGADDTVLHGMFQGVPVPASLFVRDGDQMQGQSEHIANVQFGIESEQARLQATLIANYVSERISVRGLADATDPQPDYMEDPGTTVDFVLRKGFGSFFGWDWFKPSLKFTARNLLGTEHKEYQERGGNRVDLYTYDPGVSWNLSLTLDF